MPIAVCMVTLHLTDSIAYGHNIMIIYPPVQCGQALDSPNPNRHNHYDLPADCDHIATWQVSERAYVYA